MSKTHLALLLVVASACADNRTFYDADAGAEVEGVSCLPNLDGLIERSEMPTQLGNPVSFLVSQNASIDLSSSELDLRSEFPGESKLPLIAESTLGKWFQDDFPSGSITVPLSIGGENLGILESTEVAVRLLGIVSTLPDHTLLRYESPIDLYRFPLSVGSTWSSTSAVTGTFAAVPYNGTDSYAVEVLSRDIVYLPHLRFSDAYRVHTEVVNDSGAAGVVTTRQQISLISECFGEIARVVSQENENAATFTSAAELWRFSL